MNTSALTIPIEVPQLYRYIINSDLILNPSSSAKSDPALK